MVKIEKSILIIIISLLMIFIIMFNVIKKSNFSTSNEDKSTELVWYTIGTEPEDMNLVEEEINNYLLENINATIDIRFIDYIDFTDVMGKKFDDGEKFDLVFTSSWANDYLPNVREGNFLKLDDLINDCGKDLLDTIDPTFIEGAKVKDNLYAIPNQKEIATMPMWVFSKKYVDKYNVPYKELKTLEDLEPWLKIIKENEDNVVPLYLDNSYSVPMYFDQLTTNIGVELGDESLNVVNIFETEKMKNDLKIMRRYHELGYTNSKMGNTGDFTVANFVTKADGQPYAEKIWESKRGEEVVATPILDSYITNDSTTGSMIAISKTSKNPEKAMEFLNLLNTDIYLRNLINYGIENIHYEKISRKQIKLLDKSKDYKVDYYTLGNLFITYVLENEPIDKWDEFREFNEAVKKSPTLGFKLNPENIEVELNSISTVTEEFKRSLYLGMVDTDKYLAKLNKKLKSAGIDKVRYEVERQLKEWKEEGI